VSSLDTPTEAIAKEDATSKTASVARVDGDNHHYACQQCDEKFSRLCELK